MSEKHKKKDNQTHEERMADMQLKINAVNLELELRKKISQELQEANSLKMEKY